MILQDCILQVWSCLPVSSSRYDSTRYDYARLYPLVIKCKACNLQVWLSACILQVWSYQIVFSRYDPTCWYPSEMIEPALILKLLSLQTVWYDPPGIIIVLLACILQDWPSQPVSSRYDPISLYPPVMILQYCILQVWSCPTCVLKVWSYLVWFCQTVSSCYKPASLKPPGMTVSLCPPDMILSALILYEFKKLKIDVTDNLYLKDLWIYSRVE